MERLPGPTDARHIATTTERYGHAVTKPGLAHHLHGLGIPDCAHGHVIEPLTVHLTNHLHHIRGAARTHVVGMIEQQHRAFGVLTGLLHRRLQRPAVVDKFGPRAPG